MYSEIFLIKFMDVVWFQTHFKIPLMSSLGHNESKIPVEVLQRFPTIDCSIHQIIKCCEIVEIAALEH